MPAEPPASTAVQVVALVVPGALLEVDLVAAIPA
jgi:enamine deaminase RidA (YjgF/YER057c/UK114 family)